MTCCQCGSTKKSGYYRVVLTNLVTEEQGEPLEVCVDCYDAFVDIRRAQGKWGFYAEFVDPSVKVYANRWERYMDGLDDEKEANGS
jgi:hypothetical protein